MDNAYYYMAVLSLPFLLLLRYYLLVPGKANRLPPSPTAIPFFGHLHLLGKPFHAVLSRLAARHGPVFSLRLGSRSAVVVSSPACARECFTEHDVAFANRPSLPSLSLISEEYGTILATSNYGPEWRNLRLVAGTHLLSAHRVGYMSPVISAEVRAMVVRLRRSAAASPRVQLRRRLFELSLSVLMETIADTKTTLSSNSDAEADADTDMSVEARVFKKEADEINAHLDTDNLWVYIPVMRWFDVFGVRKKVLAASSRRDAFLQRLIDSERRKLDDGGEKKSMISVLCSLQKKEPEVYTDKMIMGLCVVSCVLSCYFWHAYT
jgi:cytochrome P450